MDPDKKVFIFDVFFLSLIVALNNIFRHLKVILSACTRIKRFPWFTINHARANIILTKGNPLKEIEILQKYKKNTNPHTRRKSPCYRWKNKLDNKFKFYFNTNFTLFYYLSKMIN
jgi:hypothetical protein